MSADSRTRDKMMAAHLKDIGYPHGRRFTTSNAKHNYPTVNSPAGSAAYRRIMDRKKK